MNPDPDEADEAETVAATAARTPPPHAPWGQDDGSLQQTPSKYSDRKLQCLGYKSFGLQFFVHLVADSIFNT